MIVGEFRIDARLHVSPFGFLLQKFQVAMATKLIWGT